jgi:hypothetical protein
MRDDGRQTQHAKSLSRPGLAPVLCDIFNSPPPPPPPPPHHPSRILFFSSLPNYFLPSVVRLFPIIHSFFVVVQEGNGLSDTAALILTVLRYPGDFATKEAPKHEILPQPKVFCRSTPSNLDNSSSWK